MANKKFNSGLLVFIILLVLVCGISAFSYFEPFGITLFNSKQTKEYTGGTETVVKKSKSKNYIATIYITGTIEDANNSYNQKWLLSSIQKLKKDKNNVALALFINSPGGGVYQSDEVYFALQDYKSAGKKIYAYMGSLAASGGYYISCAADEIYANRNTLTGSIGVISGSSFDLTGLFENLGIKSETIHAGKNKNMGNYNEPLSEEQRQILQSIADECYEQFVAIVANSRNMSVQEVKKLADGRVYTAKQALENGLIDHIDSYENMIFSLQEDTTGEETSVKEYKYERKQTFMNVLMGNISDIYKNQAASKLGLPVKVLNDLEKSSLYPAYIYN